MNGHNKEKSNEQEDLECKKETPGIVIPFPGTRLNKFRIYELFRSIFYE
ncbi:MAG: hypothetical protein K8R21_16680 [Leptospira sp.]|nr:hypothetical protein [Leptospira sp.]